MLVMLLFMWLSPLMQALEDRVTDRSHASTREPIGQELA